ncbi:hypothetical protein RYX36_026877 [Vicia faba]
MRTDITGNLLDLESFKLSVLCHGSDYCRMLKQPQKWIGNRTTSCLLASVVPVPVPPPNGPPVMEYTQRNIFVSNVSSDIDAQKLLEFFRQFGEVEDGPLGLDKSIVRPKGFAYSFTLEEDTTNYDAYEKGGIVTQVTQPKVLNFKPLTDLGEFLLSDFSKFDRPPLMHLAFQALDKFISEIGRFPVASSEDDAHKFISISNSINGNLGDERLEDVNPTRLQQFAFGAMAVLNPMAAMFGSIVGQEVVKACFGKFHPLFQFFYFDSVESLPTEPLHPNDLKLINSRYDAQISVFRKKL